jgi:tRNA-dihydrouridine synthase
MEGVTQTDGPKAHVQSLDEVDVSGPHDNNGITLPVEADFMYAYSTVPGYLSRRHPMRGSWFVQAIESVFKQNALTMDVLRMMTRVNAEVANQTLVTYEDSLDSKKKMKHLKQIPSIISQLRKELYFFPDKVMKGQPNSLFWFVSGSGVM